MSQCYAFTKTGKGCRNYACIERQTSECITYGFFCKQHASLDQDTLWTMIRHNCRNLDYHESNRERIKVLLSLVKVSKEVFHKHPLLLNMARPRDLTCFFQILMEQAPSAQHSWFPRLWRSCTSVLWNWSRAMGPLLIDWSHIQSVICLTQDPLAFYEGIGRRVAPPTELYTADLWKQFLWNCCRERPGWFSAFLGTKGHEEAIKTCLLDKAEVHESIKDLFTKNSGFLTCALCRGQGHNLVGLDGYCAHCRSQNPPALPAKLRHKSDFELWVQELKKDHYSRLKSQIDPFKERLMAATWETNRHVRWCLDEDDKAEFRRWWPEVEPNNPEDYRLD